MNLTEDEVIKGLVAANDYVAGSIDTPGSDDESSDDESSDDESRDGGPRYADTMGDVDRALDLFEDLRTLGSLVQQLDERERAIMQMRFGQEMTRAEIGREPHLSHMYMSRPLTRTLTELRTGLLPAWHPCARVPLARTERSAWHEC